MGKFHLEHLLIGDNSQEIIIKILQARGFLIENQDGRLYLSDNATIGDAQYLSWGLSEYGLGEVLDKKDYVTRCRRDLYNYRYGWTYTYEAIKPSSVEINVFEKASVEAAVEFFHSSKRIGPESASFSLDWAAYSHEVFGTKTDVRYLESYVAYYVKAISSCGVYTSMSCDGNHPDGGAVYVQSSYPSNIFHEYIWEYLVMPRYGQIPYIENKISFSDQTQTELYRQIYEIADFLYLNRRAIREMKMLTVEYIDKRFRKSHSEEEIEEFYRSECRRVFTEGTNALVKC